MASKYVDIPSIVQVIGGIYENPNLLDEVDKYYFNEEDFTEEFHKIVFGSIFNLHALGAKEISINSIEDYLEQRPKKAAVFKANNGAEYLQKLKENTQYAAFDYYYNRMKKMTLLREYQKIGLNLNWLYDPDNILDLKKKQAQEDWFDRTSLKDIAELIDKKISEIRTSYVDNMDNDVVKASTGIVELIESFKKRPEVGIPLYGKFINTVTKGARLGKFYLRSAATGVGKSRSMAADACYIGCDEMWSIEEGKWITTGLCQPVLYIATEQDLGEVQTMMIAFLSAVDEDHILSGKYEAGEWDRVKKAIQVFEKGKIQFQSMPDFSLADIEANIKRGIREFDCRYVFLDYIHTSMKILEEVTRRSGGVKLREDNILFMISIRLKDICNQYQVFILSATQLNADYKESETPDQNLLRGAKSIADKIDLGLIMLETTNKDREALQDICKKLGIECPNVKISCYKNRRGSWKGIYLWCYADRGICRFNPIFVTDWNYNLKEITDLKIKLIDASAF